MGLVLILFISALYSSKSIDFSVPIPVLSGNWSSISTQKCETVQSPKN